MLELKIGFLTRPLLARESNYRLKIIENSQKITESTGKVSSKETTDVLLAIVRSEIFSLPQGEQPLEADDGGSYMISTQPFFGTAIFEKTTRKETKMVIRREKYSAPAIEAATAFNRIAEACFQKK
jgi:hypothetical protein